MSSNDELPRDTSSSCDVESLQLVVEGEGSFNRPFPSSLVPLFQSESKWETILMKMTFVCMKKELRAELIFIWKVLHLDSLWNRGTRELGNGLFDRSAPSSRVVEERDVTEEDEDDEDGIRFVTLESRFENKETVLNW